MSSKEASPRTVRQLGRRGQAIVLVAFSIAVMMGFAALAIDLAYLRTAHVEAQRAADAAALAGASAYIDIANPWMALDSVKERAKRLANANYVRGVSVDTTVVSDAATLFVGKSIKVEIIPDSVKVRVWVSRDSVPLFFARIFGFSSWRVAAKAAAEAADAGVIECLKPWAIPDENYDEASLGTLDTLKIPSDEMFDPGYDPVDSWFYAIKLDTTYMPEKTSCAAPKGDTPAQGLEERWGAPAPRPNPSTSPDNACAGEIFGAGGESCWYRSYICNEYCGEASLSESFPVIKGNMIGPTSQGVNDLILRDPDVYFDEASGTLKRGLSATPVNPDDTPRVVKVGLYSPETYTHPDQYNVNLTGFAYFFIENGPHTYKGRTGLYDPDLADAIVGRFLYYAPGSGGGSSTSPFTRYLRLVE